MAKNDVFISFKAEEINEASWVRSVLESHDISCWMAPDSIPGGSSYISEIADAISGCKIFVLLVSSKSQESAWVSKELDAAINEQKIIMPFMIENCALKNSFDFYLADVQMYEAYENKNNTIQRMVTEIKKIIDNEKTEKNAVFTDSFKSAMKKGIKKTSHGFFNRIKKFTPYAKIKNENGYLSLNIISLFSFALFIFVFSGLCSEFYSILFPLLFALALFLIMWFVGGRMARKIENLKNKTAVVILSAITGILLFPITLMIGAAIAEAMNELNIF